MEIVLRDKNSATKAGPSFPLRDGLAQVDLPVMGRCIAYYFAGRGRSNLRVSRTASATATSEARTTR